ncbi:MAG: DUF6046 domain-containing protein [Weeksellaceae bacterium]|nr:DUF6046 domain-containing protein [Weeksellaceae bacterium]
MTDIRYDIGKIFKAAFGISSPIYITQPIRIGESDAPISYTGVNALEPNKAKQMSWLGTPIIFPVNFKAGTYNIYDLNGKLTRKEMEKFQLPSATLIEFSRAKNVTTTEVLGNNGTVKEIFGFDDWQIRMRGVCLPEPNRTEIEQKESLLKWEQVAAAIEVEGELFEEKEIGRIVITDINFQQAQGKPKVIPFEITAVSDDDLELILVQKARGSVTLGEPEITIGE